MPTALTVWTLFLTTLCSGFSLAQDVYIGPSGYVEYVNASKQLDGADSFLFMRFRGCKESGPLLAVSRGQAISLVVSVINREISISCLANSGFVNITSNGAMLVPGLWYNLTLSNLSAGSDGFEMYINGRDQALRFMGVLNGFSAERLEGELYFGGHPQLGYLDVCIDSVRTSAQSIDLLAGNLVYGSVVTGCPVYQCITSSTTLTGNNSYVEFEVAMQPVQPYVELYVKFQTSAAEGVLVYIGEYELPPYTALVMVNGFVSFFADLSLDESMELKVTTPRTYNDSLLHTAYLLIKDLTIYLMVDDDSMSITIPPGSNISTFSSSLWLGGLPNVPRPSLRGCVFDFAYSNNQSLLPQLLNPTSALSNRSIVLDACLPQLTCPELCNTTAAEQCYFSCQCQPGYTRISSESCAKENECASNLCLNGGSCVTLLNNYTCQCDSQFKGRNCETVRSCSSFPCFNGGTCLEEDYGYICLCASGSFGLGCEMKFSTNVSTNQCESSPCKNGATCTPGYAGNYSCSCTTGWTGKDCDVIVDQCAVVPCMNGGLCVSRIGGYECFCPNGWTGYQCQQLVDHHCDRNPCQNGGTCVDGLTSYTCICAAGYTGYNCDVINDLCASSPCLNGSTCINLINSFLCLCPLGTTDPTCGTMIVNCSSKLCQNGATCLQQPQGFQCVCRVGYTGKYCDVIINKCSPNPCLNGGTCTMLIARYKCQCGTGFSGSNCQIGNLSSSPQLPSSTQSTGAISSASPTETILASSTENILASSTETILASSTEIILASSTETILASSTEIILASSTEIILASSTETILASSTEIILASSTETILASSTETILASPMETILPSTEISSLPIPSTQAILASPMETILASSAEIVQTPSLVVAIPSPTSLPSETIPMYTSLMALPTEVTLSSSSETILVSPTEVVLASPIETILQVVSSLVVPPSTEMTLSSSKEPILASSTELVLSSSTDIVSSVTFVSSSDAILATPTGPSETIFASPHNILTPTGTFLTSSRETVLATSTVSVQTSFVMVPTPALNSSQSSTATITSGSVIMAPTTGNHPSASSTGPFIISSNEAIPVSRSTIVSSTGLTLSSSTTTVTFAESSVVPILSASTVAVVTSLTKKTQSSSSLAKSMTSPSITVNSQGAIPPISTMTLAATGETTSVVASKVTSSPAIPMHSSSPTINPASSHGDSSITIPQANPVTSHGANPVTSHGTNPVTSSGTTLQGSSMLSAPADVTPVIAGVTVPLAVIIIAGLVAVTVVAIMLFWHRYRRRHDYYSPREAERGGAHFNGEEKARERLI